ncbi:MULTISPECIES: sugar ABC transporter permease [unclassified Mesorhizobium]|uniref:carbohydrate ABC transporter permease n=2 Tax=Mesorhizobium TaxID=68287 RepID=UPI001FDF8ED6|nr:MULTISPECIES: sugar ABC transporter permease [unclassified Mesorhizobium]
MQKGHTVAMSFPDAGAFADRSAPKSDLRLWLAKNASQLALAPSVVIVLVVIYGFMVWTGVISLTASKMLPNYSFVGLAQYGRLWSNPIWQIAVSNIFIFGFLFIGFSTAIGLALAILIDQKIRAEGFLRTVYLYPMALSFIVTGTAWKWILNPGLGLERMLHLWGWESFRFDWLVNTEYAIYTLVIAGVWQSSGFVMALFLAALRGIDEDLVKAARLDGAGARQIYRRIIIPQLGPTFMTVGVILMQQAVKSFDLVVALTSGGPGNSTNLPATFMYTQTFGRDQMAVGAASAIMILMTVAAIVVPYLYIDIRNNRNER